MFALGTYIMNVPQDGQSDLSVGIDHSVGSRLLSLVNDASPIVRRVSQVYLTPYTSQCVLPLSSQEVVCALHGLVVLYEKQFQIAALRSSESERMGASNLSTSVTPTGWIHVSIEPPEAETTFETSNPGTSPSSTVQGQSASSKFSRSLANGMARSESPPTSFDSSVGSTGSEDRFLDSLPKKTPMTQSFGPTQMSVTGSAAAKSVYNHIWKGLVFLASDPCSKVAQLAQFIVHSLHDKVTTIAVTGSAQIT